MDFSKASLIGNAIPSFSFLIKGESLVKYSNSRIQNACNLRVGCPIFFPANEDEPRPWFVKLFTICGWYWARSFIRCKFRKLTELTP